MAKNIRITIMEIMQNNRDNRAHRELLANHLHNRIDEINRVFLEYRISA